jgi:PQQ-like domain
VFTVALMALIAAGLIGIGLVATQGTNVGWTDATIDVVGSPVAAEGQVLVLNISGSHLLNLTAVNPATGVVSWERPFSASGITPGESFEPTVIGSTVIDLVPDRAAEPAVTVEGIDVATGQHMWSLPGPLVVSDAPAVCVDGKSFCVPVFTSSTTTALASVNPLTGVVLNTLSGPERAMNVVVSGQGAENSALWQTIAQAPTFVQLNSSDEVQWSKTVASLFGGSQFNPNDGWDFETYGNLEVGTVGTQPTGNAYSLGGFRTIGIAISTGQVQWSDPGEFDCSGSLQMLPTPLLCDYSGTLRPSGRSTSFTGVALTLEGFDPATGAVTWRQPVVDVKALSTGTNLPFEGDSLVVESRPGTSVLLNAGTGRTEPVPKGMTFWCQHVSPYKVATVDGGGTREGAPTYEPCTEKGHPLASLPQQGTAQVGVESDNLFIWPSPHGLQAANLAQQSS